MKENEEQRHIPTMFLVAIVIASVLAMIPSVQAAPDDYYTYARYYPAGQSGLGACGGYVDAEDDEYIYYWSGSPAGTAYKVQVETAGDPNMHPDNPNATGPIAIRTFTQISSHNCIADMGAPFYCCDADEFYVDETGIYLGPGTNGIHKWDHDWNYQGQIGPKLYLAQSLAYDEENEIWYAGYAYRIIYSLSDTDGDGSYMDETWTGEFTYPDYAGSHHDGMEYVKPNLWISDMTSDKIGQWQKVGGVWTEIQVFAYSEAAVVEGMGFGPNEHFWITGYYSNYIYEIGGGKLGTAVEGIPDQCVFEGESYGVIDLDSYVVFGAPPYSWSWTPDPPAHLTLSVDAGNMLTVTYPAGWTGSEMITFTATDSAGTSSSDDATFTVCPVPVVGDIPDQTAPFVSFDLDDYLSGIDPGDVTWSASYTDGGWTVDIDGDNVVTVSAPAGATDPKTVTFTATTVCCGREASDSDDATFSPTLSEIKLCPDEYRWNKSVSPTGYEWDPFPELFRGWNDVHFINSGPGDAYSVTATITCTPVNVVVVDGVVSLGDIPAGSGAWSQDFFVLETDMTNPQDPNKGICWRVEYDDASGVHHVIEDVPKFCGERCSDICP